MPYLFQVSIGPVQSFIKGARRTRDLKFGSSFLIEISWEATQIIRKICGAESLIFPAIPLDLSEGDKLDDVPNKILAYLPAGISCEKLASEIKEQIDRRMKTIKDMTFRHIETPFDYIGAEQQIADLVEYIWAAVEYDAANPSMRYDEARRKLEALMAARKNTRDFKQASWANKQPKSSIDGLLESVILEDAYPPSWSRVEKAVGEQRERLKKAYLQKSEALRRNFDAGPHEKLSGVDLLKRLGPIGDGVSAFPSTSHMAAVPFLSGLKCLAQPDIERRLQRYIDDLLEIRKIVPSFQLDILPQAYQNTMFGGKALTLGEYDGALLYPERFPDIVGDSQILQDRNVNKLFQGVTSTLEGFYKDIKLHPDPYYALLVADGDSMGKVIDHQARNGMARHKQLSEALAKFATSVRGIIEEQTGVRIYSGGDDVLAMLPLHTAIDCARQLAKVFQGTLKDFTDGKGKSPTLSVGLAIVHHLHPLGDALRIAREAEGRAKQGGKNALAITVQKRGGSPCEVGGGWDIFDTRLERQIGLYQRDRIPSGMAYELEEIALRLEPDVDYAADSSVSPPHVQYAALRVFQRKLSETKRKGQDDAQVALTLDMLKEMIGLEQIQPVRVGRLAHELIVARLFAQARQLANGQNEGGAEA